jgi:hypothetical protein
VTLENGCCSNCSRVTKKEEDINRKNGGNLLGHAKPHLAIEKSTYAWISFRNKISN